MPLQELDLDGAHVADLSALRGMPLQRLLLNGTLVDDVSPLQACKDLKYLDLRGSHVDRADVPALWRAVPNCKIEWPAPAKRGSPR
jgi:hypothetical protein